MDDVFGHVARKRDSFVRRSAARLVLSASTAQIPLLCQLWVKVVFLSEVEYGSSQEVFEKWTNCTLTAFEEGASPSDECGSLPPKGVRSLHIFYLVFA